VLSSLAVLLILSFY